MDGASRSRCAQRRIAGAYRASARGKNTKRKHRWLAANSIRTAHCDQGDIFYQAVLCSTLMLALLSSRHARPLALAMLSSCSITLDLLACFSCHGSGILSTYPHPSDDVSSRQVFQMCQMQLQIHSTPCPCSSYPTVSSTFPRKENNCNCRDASESLSSGRRSHPPTGSHVPLSPS